ncbi:MAG: hypothetical protein ABJA86_10435 [Nocardioidaceae bacterium]
MMRKNLLAAIAALAVMAVVVAIAVLASRGSDAPAQTVSEPPAGDSGSAGTEPGDQPTGSGWTDEATDPSGTRGGSTVPGYPGQNGAGSNGWPGNADPGGPMLPVDPGSGHQQFNTMAIADAHIDAQGRLVLTYYVGLPSCSPQLDHVDVVQTVAKVTVTLVQGTDPQVPSGIACPDIAMAKSTRVTLTSPLGGRTVVDGSTGDTVPVS